MTTIYPPQLLQELEHSTIFLDTNVFGSAARSESFLDLLVDLKNNRSCSFTTIPSVIFEFTNGSSTLEIYNQRADFIKSLVDSVINPHNFADKITDFAVTMAKINAANKAYTDFLLASCLYNWRHIPSVFLLTADLRALPPFFDRISLVTTEEKSADVRNFGIYKFNETKYANVAKKLLSNE